MLKLRLQKLKWSFKNLGFFIKMLDIHPSSDNISVMLSDGIK